jgi:hypothetical protein
MIILRVALALRARTFDARTLRKQHKQFGR